MLRHPRVWTGFLLLSAINQTNAAWTVNMAPGTTEASQSVFDLRMTIFWVCMVIDVLVSGAMFWSIIVHRRSTGQQPAHFHESTTVEILWTVVPFVILMVMAVPVIRTLIRIYDASESEPDVQVTGYQWKWQCRHLGQDVEYFSNLAAPQDRIHNRQAKDEHYLLEVDEPLVLPVGTRVRFLVTFSDVIHSWRVPAFTVKRDATPGFVNEAWTKVDEPNIYRGQCTELYGKNYGSTPIVVNVKSKAEFDQWLAKHKEEAARVRELTNKEWTKGELVARGNKVYHTICTTYRQAGGQGMPPMFPTPKGSRIVTGPKECHLEAVFNNVPGIAMTAFGRRLNEIGLAAVITYERNAQDNDSGDTVTPKDVVACKQKQ